MVIALGFSDTFAVPPTSKRQARRSDYETELTTIGREFAQYRTRLRMSPHTHDADLWAWNGPFHTVMARLGQGLGDGAHTEREVQQLMGAPGRRFRGGEWTGALWVPSAETHLIYEWRGGHDYLYFIVKHGRVVGARWWLAGE